MLSNHFARLIEDHAEQLADGLVQKLHHSERTRAYHQVPADVLKHQLTDIYRNLSNWMTAKTEGEIERRYSELGRRRAEQGFPISDFTWALILSKEHLWHFLLRESMSDRATQLLSEIEFLLLMEQFFDRALYYGIVGHQRQGHKEEAA